MKCTGRGARGVGLPRPRLTLGVRPRRRSDGSEPKGLPVMQYLRVATDQNVCVIRVDDALDEANVPPMLQEVDRLIESGVTCLVMDCRDLTYISSYGLSVFLRLRKSLRDHTGLADAVVHLARVNHLIEEVVRMSRLDRILPLHLDVDSAVRACRLSCDGSSA